MPFCDMTIERFSLYSVMRAASFAASAAASRSSQENSKIALPSVRSATLRLRVRIDAIDSF